MDKITAAELPEAEVYAKAQELARLLSGEDAARRVRLLTPDQARNFLVSNGS